MNNDLIAAEMPRDIVDINTLQHNQNFGHPTLYKNYSTELHALKDKPLQSKFDSKRHASFGRTGSNGHNATFDVPDVSILFSAVKKKTTNQMKTTLDDPLGQNLDQPQPPQLTIKKTSVIKDELSKVNVSINS